MHRHLHAGVVCTWAAGQADAAGNDGDPGPWRRRSPHARLYKRAHWISSGPLSTNTARLNDLFGS
eukprot:6190443-Pleurochrysis_carterae.AAC.5